MICEVNHRLNKVSYEETKTIIQQQKLVEQLNMNRQKEMKHYEEQKRKQEQEEIQRKEIEKQKIIEENKKREIEEIERKRKEIELNQKKIKEQQMNMKLNQPIGKNLEMNNLPILNEMTDLMDYDDNIDGNSHFKQEFKEFIRQHNKGLVTKKEVMNFLIEVHRDTPKNIQYFEKYAVKVNYKKQFK